MTLLALLYTSLSFVDTSRWIGAEYTPSSAPGNSLWWYNYTNYEAEVKRELHFAKTRLATTAIRVFLHTLVFEDDAARLLRNIDRFLGIADANNITVGLVFFGDCFNHVGQLNNTCQPKKGTHNGCWTASPTDAERTSIDRFKPYVTDVVKRFGQDRRVAWFEIFNEPSRKNLWSTTLRSAGYQWAKGVKPAPLQPIFSLWDDNNATDVVDHHDYGTDFAGEWTTAIYSDPKKGAFVTEAGSRWYQPPYSSDQGSPLTVFNYLTALRREKAAGTRPFVPGAMVCWELMVGNSNTRWHWNSAVGSAEPAIPWDAWLFPDGTPISHTEAAAMRRYVSGGADDEFLAFEDFLPKPAVVASGDVTHTLKAGDVWSAPLSNDDGVSRAGDVLAEATFWPTRSDSVFALYARAGSSSSSSSTGVAAPRLGGYAAVVNGSILTVERQELQQQQQQQQRGDGDGDDDGSQVVVKVQVLGRFDLSALENGVVIGAWNMLRLVVKSNGGSIAVWFNPMYKETGMKGDAEDYKRVPTPLPPRIAVVDPKPLAVGHAAFLAITAGVSDVRVDYTSALPANVF